MQAAVQLAEELELLKYWSKQILRKTLQIQCKRG
jgi:hypothetical protein